MNNDIYYLKYLKYKKKYLNEKNKIGGADCGKEETAITTELEKLNIFGTISSIFNLLLQPTNKDNIIKKIEDIYNENVLGLIKLDKDCLKGKLIKNLSDIFNQLSIYNSYKFSNGEYQSLNIKKGAGENNFLKEIDLDNKEFARGTSFITIPPNYKDRNLRYLTNLINIKFKYIVEDKSVGKFKYIVEDKSVENLTGGAEFFIESMRFGTPLEPTDKKDFYKDQIKILQEYTKSQKCIFISLLDVCDSIVCKAEKAKLSENDIIKEEINGYSATNTVYFYMSCNNNVNMPNALSVINSSYRLNQYNYFVRLSSWIDDSRSTILINLRDKKIKEKSFFERFKENILDNNYDDEYLVSELSIKKFVVKTEIETKNDNPNLRNILEDKDITPCEVDLTRENIRLAMFCYISLIFYFLSREKPKEYILLYHCKSGQDRTGTFYAINQMVNEITTKHYNDIVNAILKYNSDFLDIFRRYYSLINTPLKDITPFSKKKEDCYDLDLQKSKINEKKITNINKEVESCYLKYLLFSYNITLTSTGCPGLKWGLGTSFGGKSLSNNFPYLLTTEPYLAVLFEGASSRRGS